MVALDAQSSAPSHDAPPPEPSLKGVPCSVILNDLAHPDASLSSVAEQHSVSVADLTLFLSRPDVQARLREVESGASTHIRLAAALNLNKALHSLLTTLDQHIALSKRLEPDDPVLIRYATHARRASYHVIRLTRHTPFNPDALPAAPRRAPAQTAMSRPSSRTDAHSTPAPQAPGSAAQPAPHSSIASAPHRSPPVPRPAVPTFDLGPAASARVTKRISKNPPRALNSPASLVSGAGSASSSGYAAVCREPP